MMQLQPEKKKTGIKIPTKPPNLTRLLNRNAARSSSHRNK
jgi:hypothetical protein